jgi:hypothetical protein
MDTAEVDGRLSPQYFSSALSVQLHSDTELISDSSKRISYFACSVIGPSCEREKGFFTQPEDRAMAQAVSRWLCHGSGRQSVVVPWLRQSVGGCAMAQLVNRRLCQGSGGQPAIVPWLRQSVGGCAMAQAVNRWLYHGSGGQSAVVPWLRWTVSGCTMAQAVSRRPCRGSGSKLSAAHRQCVWDLC